MTSKPEVTELLLDCRRFVRKVRLSLSVTSPNAVVHSLSNWLVNKAKVEPKTVQGILRHARVQTTLDLYTQGDSDETLAAQGEYLTALGVGSYMVQ